MNDVLVTPTRKPCFDQVNLTSLEIVALKFRKTIYAQLVELKPNK